MSKASDEPSSLQELSTQDLQRTSHANEFYLSICEESGLPIVSWHSFDSWKEYVDGHISETQLSDQARIEMQELSRSFGKFVFVDRNEENRHLDKEKEKKERAKQANKIYRKVCHEAGVEVSFFQDFGSWSDYVEGKINEDEFYERARAEVTGILAKSRSI